MVSLVPESDTMWRIIRADTLVTSVTGCGLRLGEAAGAKRTDHPRPWCAGPAASGPRRAGCRAEVLRDRSGARQACAGIGLHPSRRSARCCVLLAMGAEPRTRLVGGLAFAARRGGRVC